MHTDRSGLIAGRNQHYSDNLHKPDVRHSQRIQNVEM
jgi:hypothetical protein